MRITFIQNSYKNFIRQAFILQEKLLITEVVIFFVIEQS